MNENTDVLRFGCGAAPSGEISAAEAGNKAANLMRMAGAGLPVPPGFVLTTALCRRCLQNGGRLPDGFEDVLRQDIRPIEQATGLTFGGERRPLLVSVRSGAAVSMPGMMDTILNVGLCERTLNPLIRMTGNPRHAWDSYRRLIEAYAEVVHGMPPDIFERRLGRCIGREEVPVARELDVAALKQLTREYLAEYETFVDEPFPQDPLVQLRRAVEAVFRSWKNPRAAAYRRLHRLDDQAGTAATVQAMVFGNMGGTSGSGVAFTRNPANGDRTLYVDFLWNAQGEDLVAGRCPVQDSTHLEQALPGLHRDLRKAGRKLEQLFNDVQDFEFTVQEGHLYLLQSRDAKRTPWAALRIACDLVNEGLIDATTALKRLSGYDLPSINWVRLARTGDRPPLCRGTAASPGVAVGIIALSLAAVEALAGQGRPAILVRNEISTSDIAGLEASAGVLTARGGRTSHAAVVARQLNKVCIVGCRDLLVQEDRRQCRLGERSFREGDFLSLDGNCGDVYEGKLEVVVERPTECLRQVQQWKNSL